ncbi:hypothetical protein Rhal01_01909 [Rubritalea halochordaticola]|uniref:S9 family peptidase n=1 Tax=Rubritalea halochordaticola TaxID=714537 RepID=A0ABP9V176_9BACT
MRFFLTLYLGLMLSAAAEHGFAERINGTLRKDYVKQSAAIRNLNLKPYWAEDGSSFIYRKEIKGGQRYIIVDAKTGEQKEAFDHKIMEEFFASQDKKMELHHMVFGEGYFEFRIKGDRETYQWDGEQVIKVDSPRKKQQEEQERMHRGPVSPDGKWRVDFREHNVVLVELEKGEKILTSDGKPDHYYAQVKWAPDSSRFAVMKVKAGQRRMVTVVESSPKDQLQPKVHSWRYDKPGDVIDTRAPWVFYVDGRDPLAPDLSLIENPFSLGKVWWRSDSKRLSYDYVERGYGKYYVLEADTEARSHRIAVREESDTYIFVGGNSYRYDVNDGEEYIWASERDGWNHLYLIDGKTGAVKNQITKGEWVVFDVERVDEDNRRILFIAGGMEKGKDPYYRKYYWINFDGTGLVELTPGDGTHELFLSPDDQVYLDKYSRYDMAPVYELRNLKSGSLIKEILRVDLEELKATGWQAPIAFTAKDRDGKFDVWGYVLLPKDFEPKKKYPVIENIYAGPHDQHVYKPFTVWRGAITDLAHRGFIMVRIDGKGTGKRCKEFSHFCYKNIVDAGFPDRIKWMKEAAKKYPQMDLERVGIYGGSAGGQNSTGALLFHGDFYKVAVSDCGCHDNRMDKIWWNEQWMDWPIGPHYAEQSNVTNASKLKGRLLLTVGEMDRNVDPASTYQLASALLKAGKEYELIVVPSADHGAGEQLYPRCRRVQFFEKWLGAPAPMSN